MKTFLRLTAAALIAAIALPASAAHRYKPKDPGQVGIRVSYDLTGCTDSYGFIKSGSGFSVGASYTAYLASRIYFSPSVLFSYGKMKFDGPLEEKRHVDINGDMTDIGARVPLDFGFNFVNASKVKASIFTGPQLHFNFSLRDKFDLHFSSGGDRHHESTVVTSGLEICWAAGVAVDLMRHWHVQAGYTIGLSKMGKSDVIMIDPVTFRRSEVNITLGYNF